MSKLAELAYDIEQLYIEGHSPKVIAAMLECPLTMVYDWLEDNSIRDEEDETIDPAEWDVAFPPQDYYGA
jgi:DNA-directed RNA polymerase specialized sigma24 family protein